jgi:large subunit ribosomal protein L37Ae
MGRTKKVGTTGRFGPRYGTRTKKVIRVLEKLQRQKHECPSCERKTLKRVAAGIWLCKKCGLKLAGGAYLPQSSATKVIKQTVERIENV